MEALETGWADFLNYFGVEQQEREPTYEVPCVYQSGGLISFLAAAVLLAFLFRKRI